MKPPYHGQKVRLSSPTAMTDAIGYFVLGPFDPFRSGPLHTVAGLHFRGYLVNDYDPAPVIRKLYVYTDDKVTVL